MRPPKRQFVSAVRFLADGCIVLPMDATNVTTAIKQFRDRALIAFNAALKDVDSPPVCHAIVITRSTP
jgi:hypothetical protein